MDKDLKVMLNDFFKSNGYLDETIGSWHRYVDAQEAIAEAINNLAEAVREKNA
jgi:hypothetical protein